MKAFLHNIYVLYTIFIISLINFLYLGYVNDMNSVYIFILITILVTFFNKNMIIVLGLAFIVTNILRIGNIRPLHFLHSETNKEGFKESDKESEEKEESQENQPKKKTKEESTKESTKEESTKKESTKEESTKKETEEKQPKKKTKEEFHPNKSSLLSSEKKDLEPQDKMIFAQEKLLERMNKYKPLLDTLQGITKNIAFVKGMSNAVPTDL